MKTANLCVIHDHFPFSVFFFFLFFSFFLIASSENISIHFDILLFTVVEKPEGKKQPTDIEAGEKFGVCFIGCFSVCMYSLWNRLSFYVKH